MKCFGSGSKALINNGLRKKCQFPVGARGVKGGLCQMCHDEILAKGIVLSLFVVVFAPKSCISVSPDTCLLTKMSVSGNWQAI